MSYLTAMEYLLDIVNVYIKFIPVTKTTQEEMKKALYMGIGALKTLEDMKTKGASLYGQTITGTSTLDSEKP